jgi:hypothetical protein
MLFADSRSLPVAFKNFGERIIDTAVMIFTEKLQFWMLLLVPVKKVGVRNGEKYADRFSACGRNTGCGS